MEYCISGDDGTAAIWNHPPDLDLDGDGRFDAIGLDLDGDGMRDDAL
ncbi:MAG: pullulanase, partial [Mycobacterium sp.]